MRQTVRPQLLMIAILAGTACGPRKLPTAAPAANPAVSRVVLLKSPDGTTGRVAVKNAGGETELTVANTAARIANAASAPSAPETLDEAEVQRRFGRVLQSLPAPEVRFTLNFLEASDSLTPESQASIEDVKKAIAERHSRFISVTGHTDTTGTDESNRTLGMRRAERLAEILKTAGVAAETIFVSSHGEGDLLVKTGDNVAEVRNRRVEIVIR